MGCELAERTSLRLCSSSLTLSPRYLNPHSKRSQDSTGGLTSKPSLRWPMSDESSRRYRRLLRSLRRKSHEKLQVSRATAALRSGKDRPAAEVRPRPDGDPRPQ